MNPHHDTHRPDPLAHPGVVRILLGEAASKALLEVGEAFAIVGRTSYPDQPGRLAIFCQPCPMATATAACQILAGTHRAQRIKTAPSVNASPAASPEPANTPEARPRPSQANVAQPSPHPPLRNLFEGPTPGKVPRTRVQIP